MPAKTAINTLLGADQPKAVSVLTIGHGNHPIEKFLGLLRQHGVDVLVDARSQPFSRSSHQFSRKALERAVTEASIRYLFMGDLLGGRPESRECYDAEAYARWHRPLPRLHPLRGGGPVALRPAAPHHVNTRAPGRRGPTHPRTRSR